ncbi:MAG: DMT family transporter [Pseudomonadota bacterium]
MPFSYRSWRISPYLLLSLTALFWAGNWVIGRAIHSDVPPIALAFWRWLIASVVLLPFAWRHIVREWDIICGHWRILTLLAVLGTGLYNALAYWGLQYTTATNGVLLNSATPIMIIALSALVFGERLSMRQYVGVTTSLLGVLAIITHGDLQTLTSLTLNVGDFWVLASDLVWAVYTGCLRWRPTNLNALSFLWTLMIIGLLPMLPVYLWEISTGRHLIFNTASLLSLGYVGIFPALLGYIFWNRGVAAVGANRASLFIHLMPVFGALLSFIFLGEQPQLFQIIGIGLIFTGIYLTTRE